MLRKQQLSNCLGFACAALALAMVFSSSVFAQSNRDSWYYGGGSVVGGVEINADGSLRIAPSDKMQDVGKNISRLFEAISPDLNVQTPIRKISLKRLDAELQQIIEQEKPLPDAIRYLGGLTAISYVVVDPEANDVLLVGPAEGWKTDGKGNVLGKTSGRPVMQFEDLLTIYRAWQHQDRPSVITCSIDPTPEAIRKLAQVDRQFNVLTNNNIRAYAAAQEEAYGLNTVTVQGVPTTSRFAKVLVAADYKLKQIGLGHEPSHVSGLPSYTSLLSGNKQRTPRFWLAPEYGTVTHDSQKQTWKLSEVKVKTLSEDEFIEARSQSRQASGRTDKAALNWCSKMDKNYDALCKVEPVFGDLKNCMELAMAVALIQREGLLEKAGCKIPTIANVHLMTPPALPIPKTVPSKALISRNGRTLVVACGGVEINPFETIYKASLDSKIDSRRKELVETTGDSWWSK